MKKIYFFLMIMAICCISGCVSRKDEIKKTSQAAITYLNQKYGKTFYLISYEIDGSTDIIRAYTDGMDTENEYVAVYPDSNDSTKFSDNYFSYLIKDEMEEEIKNVLGIEECKIYRDNTSFSFPDSLNENSTVEDLYQQSPGYMASVNIYLPSQANKTDNDYQQITDRLENWIKEKKRSYSITLFVVSEQYYQNIDRYKEDEFWRYYATHRDPDGVDLFYVYTEIFIDGEIV